MNARGHRSNNVVTGEERIDLENGYSIAIRKELIPAMGRSIYRGMDKEQVVMMILDRRGEVTNRFPIPNMVSKEVAKALAAGL